MFVIVILGILTSVALPKLMLSRDDAIMTKAKMQISAVRVGISQLYSKNILKGLDTCPELEKDDNTLFFEGVLSNGLSNEDSILWELKEDGDEKTLYKLTIGKRSCDFVYDKNSSRNCRFYCKKNELCEELGK